MKILGKNILRMNALVSENNCLIKFHILNTTESHKLLMNIVKTQIIPVEWTSKYDILSNIKYHCLLPPSGSIVFILILFINNLNKIANT